MTDIRKRTGAKGPTYQVRYADIAAATGYSYKTFETAKEARAFTETLGEHKRSSRLAAFTVAQAVDLWLSICEKTGRDGREQVEPQTLLEYKRRARVIKEYHWPKSLQDLEPSDVTHFRNWLLQTKSRDLARRTLSSFHSVLIEMVLQGQLRSDPAAGICIKSGGRYEDEDSEIQIPSDREMRDIYGAADVMGKKNDFMAKCWARYRPMIYLAGFSGMRPSEYRGLAWHHLFEDKVTVRQRADKTGIIGPVKSRAGKRTIYLPRLVTDMVFEWQERCPKSDAQLVFPTATGRPQALNNFWVSAWTPLLKEAGLIVSAKEGGKETESPKYAIYCLRHYFASKLIETSDGKNLKFIQEVMGHSKIEITLNIYGHLLKDREDSKRQVAEDLIRGVFAIPCGKSVALEV